MSASHAMEDTGPFDVGRTIPLLPVTSGTLDEAVSKMGAIKSIKNVHIEGRGQLHIRYDASNPGISDIERFFEESEIGHSTNI